MAITQGSNRAAINWQSFDVGSQAKVNIFQPSASSILLNRIQGERASQIFGQINANGQVVLSNPAGVYFSPTARVDVGSLVATTHSIADADFMAGAMKFSRNGATGKVINEGSITAALGGYVALLAPEVRNSGVVIARMGTVALAAGEAFEMQFNGQGGLANVIVTPATIAALVENGRAVQAPGGLIILSAQAANQILGGVVRNTGSLQADGMSDNGGVIRLSASHKIELAPSSSISADAAPGSAGQGGRIEVIADLSNPGSSTQVDGSLSAKGGERGGDGGFIETSAALLKIADSARVSTLAPQGRAGYWLLDPNDFEVSSTGNISGSTLSTLLGSGNVTLQAGTGTDTSSDKFGNVSTSGTAGDINIYDAVSWTANTLTLNAGYNINVGSSTKTGSLTVSGAGALVLNPSSASVTGYTAGGMVLMGMASTPTGGPTGNGFNGSINLSATDATRLLSSSGSPVLQISGNNYTVIKTLGSASDYSTSSNNYTLQGMAASNNVGTGYWALGNDIDASATSTWTNLNGGLGFYPIGKQAGNFAGGCDCRFWGVFDGLGHAVTHLYQYRPNLDQYNRGNVGLIAYALISARVANIGVTGDITGQTSLGGLVGAFDSTSYSLPQIANSYSAVNVTVLNSSGTAGGLAGSAGYVVNSYATGDVTATGASNVGGLIGTVPNYGTSTVKIDQSFATGRVTGASNVGGLIGSISSGGSVDTVSNSYATGNVSGTGMGVGGLVGEARGITISGSYATGTVSGSNFVGGLVGFAQPVAVSGSYATGNVTLLSGGSNGGGLVGYLYGGSITSSFASGNVSGSDVGGLTGTSQTNSSITNSYATGNVTLTSATGQAGGLIAYLPGSSSDSISNNYASGSVTQTGGSGGSLGGLVGSGNGRSFTDNYWNSTNNPSLSSTTGGIGGSSAATSGVTALTTTAMKSASGFSSGFGNSNGAFTVGSGWGYAAGVNGGLPVLCAITACTAYDSSLVAFTYNGASNGLWSIASNWLISGTSTVASFAPTSANASGVSALTVNAGSVVDYNTASVGSLGVPIANAGTIAFTGNSHVSVTGVISGTGAVTKAGAGTVTFSGANTYSGGTTVSAGTLTAGSGSALGTGAVSLGASAVLDLTYSGTVALGSTLSMAAGSAITNSANTSNLTVAGASTLVGNVNTAGHQTYTGAVTLSGNTTLTTLNTSQANTNGNITFGSTVDSSVGNNHDLSVSNGSGSTVFGGAVGASTSIGNLALNGTGSITLNANVTTAGNQTYSGPVTVAAGVTLTANDGLGSMGIITNGNNNNSYYAFGVPSTSNLAETNYYWVASGSSSASITSASNDNIGIMFFNNTGSLNGAGAGSSWCCYNYPVLVNAGKSNYLSSISVVSRGDGMTNRMPTFVSVYGSNTPFTSSYTYTNGMGNSNSISNVAIQGTGYQQSNFTLLGSGAISFAAGGPSLSNSVSISSSSAYQYYQLVFTTTGGTSSGVSPNLAGPLALNAINLYGQSISNTINFNQAVTANGALTINAGSLSAAGLSAAGSVLINSRNDSTITGSISDGSAAASLTKSGAGTLSLSGTNTFTGGTTIAAGTLQVGSGGTTGSLPGSVSNSGALVINRSNALTLSGDISGTGSVTQAGTGTVTLSGTNTYSGGTTVSAGTLQVGAGSTSGSIEGDVVNNATLAFDRSGNLSYSGVVSGTGAVTKAGSGTLLLSGANTYSGGTTVSAGTLQVGAGGTSGSIAGNVVNSATLAFNRSDALSYAGVISGTGAVTKDGAGTITLTGANTYSGGTTVSAGTLAVGSGSALGTGAVSLGASAILDLTYSGTVALGSTLSMAAGSAITNSANTSNLSVAGASTLVGNVNTSGNQTYTGAVTLSGDTTLTTLNTSQTNTNGTITFGATVDGTSSGAQSLTVTSGTGAVAFGSAVGNTAPLSALTITGGTTSTGQTTTLGGNVTTSGNQTYGGNLILEANTSLTSTANSGNGTVTIAGNVNSSSTNSNGILQFLGDGYWEISTNNGNTWAYYTSTSSTSTYQASGANAGVSFTSTASALASTPTITYSSGVYSWVAPAGNYSYLVLGGGGGGGWNGGGGGGGGGVLQNANFSTS
ncbi:MAG: autotransporter-associated beta strand repeat-containing protein, partial [Betaproteobacteria bacterium]